jgi:predicted glycoside hydrolase/deacetylase ChbG (UPF0249 family)
VIRLLIVNADDFGLTAGVSRGILRAHREGIVTSVSVLAVAPAFAESARMLRREAPELGAGVHLALVGEDPPLSPPSRVRSLVGEDGRFPRDWRGFLARSTRARTREIEEELGAQIESARDAVLDLDHLDAHQHLHLLPKVRRAVLRLARRFEIRGIRVTRSRLRRPPGLGVRWLGRGLVRAAARERLLHPDACEGFDQSGRMDRAALRKAITRAGARGPAVRSVEILTHPGEADDPDRERYDWGYAWGAELAALVDPEIREDVARLGFRLGTYRDLPEAPE